MPEHEIVQLPPDSGTGNGASGSTQLGVYAGYQVPPEATGIARAQADAPPALTETDRLRTDPGTTPAELPEWPEGAPELRPLLRLPFDQRADAMDAFASIQAAQRLIGEMPKKGDDVDPEKMAKLYRLYAKLDQFLLAVATDRAAYEAWPGRWDDTQFAMLWSAYQARMTPGEAERSSS